MKLNDLVKEDRVAKKKKPLPKTPQRYNNTDWQARK
jgi:hypothetical protein